MSARRKGVSFLAVYAAAYLVFLYGPVAFLPLFSFNDSLFIAFPLKGFTLKWYAAMASDEAMHAALANTLKVGAAASLASTALALLAARALTRGRIKGRAAILAAANLPLLIPEIVLGIALLITVTAARLPLSLYSVALGHVDRKSTRLNSSHVSESRMPSSA